jgi:hypothetical protein
MQIVVLLSACKTWTEAHVYEARTKNVCTVHALHSIKLQQTCIQLIELHFWNYKMNFRAYFLTQFILNALF